MIKPGSDNSDDLLMPREVAELFGVRVATIARWAREGRLEPLYTPGGHRRYLLGDIRRFLSKDPEDEAERQLVVDAVRLYDQGWNIRQVAERFDRSYGVMRRILVRHTTVRTSSGKRD